MTYMKALPAIRAREQLDRIEAASVPHMGKHDIDRLMGRLTRELGVVQKPVRPTREQLAAIGVRTLPVTAEQWAEGANADERR